MTGQQSFFSPVRILWFFYFAMIAWALGFTVLHGRYLRVNDRAAFLENGRTLLHHYALVLGDVLTADEPLLAQVYVRRLAGEKQGVYALLTDSTGRVNSSAGSPPGTPWAEKLSDVSLKLNDFRATEVPVTPPYVELAEPVWMRGKRVGVLRWGVSVGLLRESRHLHFVRLGAIWAWAALFGAVGTFLFARRLNVSTHG